MVTDERDKESITYIIIIYWIVMYAFADWMVFGRHSVADRYSNNLNICILCLLNVDDGTFSCICEEGW